MNTLLFTLLSDSESFRLKNTEVRNVPVASLTVDELQIIFFTLFSTNASFKDVTYPSSFALEMLLRRISMHHIKNLTV
jgi:hypothetical protein